MTYEYILVALLDDHRPGDAFAQWPLHVTLVPWFSPLDLKQFIEELKRKAGMYAQITSTVGEQRIWGPHTVNVIDRVPVLQELHTELLALVRLHGRLLINEQYTGENYTPHVTRQSTIAAAQGRIVTIHAVYLISRPAGGGQKTVLSKIPLTAG